MSFKDVTHVIFDMDGLLLDTERLYTLATQDLASEYSKEYTWDIKVRCMGMKGDVSAQIIIDSLGLPMTVEQYMKRIDAIYAKYFPMAQLLPDNIELYLRCHNLVLEEYGQELSWDELIKAMGHTALETAESFCQMKSIPVTPHDYMIRITEVQKQLFPSVQLTKGADRLVRHLKSHGVPIAIASGSSQLSYDLKTTNHKDFMSLFDHKVLVSSDPEVKMGKPAPDAFLVCANRFANKPLPEKCLVFEDAPNGVQAALAAKMQCVMVPDPRTDAKLTEGATQVLKSLEDFKPELFGLPPFES